MREPLHRSQETGLDFGRLLLRPPLAEPAIHRLVVLGHGLEEGPDPPAADLEVTHELEFGQHSDHAVEDERTDVELVVGQGPETVEVHDVLALDARCQGGGHSDLLGREQFTPQHAGPTVQLRDL